jgi:hypothetical protein
LTIAGQQKLFLPILRESIDALNLQIPRTRISITTKLTLTSLAILSAEQTDLSTFIGLELHGWAP